MKQIALITIIYGLIMMWPVSTFAIPHGDIDNSGTITMQDAIMALQITSGMSPGAQVYTSAEVSGDNKIGIAEAIYILQCISELRIGFDIPDDKPVIIAASDALATGNIPLFNKYLSKSTGGIGSLSSEKAIAIADAFKNAKMISEDGVGMKTWEMTFNGEKITFSTILEDGEWKLI